MAMTKFRTNHHDGTVACAHRDLSVCTLCAEDPKVFEVMGAHYRVPAGMTRDEAIAAVFA